MRKSYTVSVDTYDAEEAKAIYDHLEAWLHERDPGTSCLLSFRSHDEPSIAEVIYDGLKRRGWTGDIGTIQAIVGEKRGITRAEAAKVADACGLTWTELLAQAFGNVPKWEPDVENS